MKSFVLLRKSDSMMTIRLLSLIDVDATCVSFLKPSNKKMTIDFDRLSVMFDPLPQRRAVPRRLWGINRVGLIHHPLGPEGLNHHRDLDCNCAVPSRVMTAVSVTTRAKLTAIKLAASEWVEVPYHQ